MTTRRHTRLKPRDVDQIVEFYQSKARVEDIATRFSVDPVTVYNWLRRRDITIRPQAKRYFCNEHFFDELSSEASSYWFGFLLADGCVTRDCISLELHERDKGHIEKFAQQIEATYPIKPSRKSCYRIEFLSRTMSASLAKHGLVERKTAVATLPSLEPDQQRHCIRGLIDGDGWITKRKAGLYEVGFSSGSEQLMDQVHSKLCEFAGKKCGHRALREKEGQSCHQLTVGGRLVVRDILTHLYGNTTVALDRKSRLARLATER